MSIAALQINCLNAGYGPTLALREVGLTVPEGDFLALVGPNGGGKSTLLKVLLGLLPARSGNVRIFGKPPARGRRCMAYVPQGAHFDPQFPVTVQDVVRMGRVKLAPNNAIIQEQLEKFSLADLRHEPIAELSGGQRQRTYLARAWATEAPILLLDEPTAYLDPEFSSGFYDLLKAENEAGKTIILTTHDTGVVSRYANRVGCLSQRLYMGAEGGLTEEILEKAYGGPVRQLKHDHPHD
ncbi:MAG: metal ABC transporter ATP-binding protein [Fimbriimonadaceae bacterium]